MRMTCELIEIVCVCNSRPGNTHPFVVSGVFQCFPTIKSNRSIFSFFSFFSFGRERQTQWRTSNGTIFQFRNFDDIQYRLRSRANVIDAEKEWKFNEFDKSLNIIIELHISSKMDMFKWFTNIETSEINTFCTREDINIEFVRCRPFVTILWAAHTRTTWICNYFSIFSAFRPEILANNEFDFWVNLCENKYYYQQAEKLLKMTALNMPMSIFISHLLIKMNVNHICNQTNNENSMN